MSEYDELLRALGISAEIADVDDGDVALACEIHEACRAIEALTAENERLRAALSVPEVWSDEETDGMAQAFKDASEKHGHYETIFAVGAWLLRYRRSCAQLEGQDND